jgi:CBS domain-containing protein
VSDVNLRQILTESSIGELTLKEVPILRVEDRIGDAAGQMRKYSHGSALVCDATGKLVGIFTERDLLRAVAKGTSLEQPLSGAMTASPTTVTTHDAVLRAIQLMDEGGYRRLPVVDQSGRAVSVIDVKSVVHFLVEHFPSAVYNQASHAQLTAKSREGA